MGIYNTFRDGDIEVQLKAGICQMRGLEVEASVMGIRLGDGVYLSPNTDGTCYAVVIQGGNFVAITRSIFNKWGELVDLGAKINEGSPVIQSMKRALAEIERHKEQEGP